MLKFDGDDVMVGVVADTHVPDRAKEMHPGIIPIFRNAGVQVILHAGDICAPGVIEELKSVAPIVAALGNRDWFFYKKLARIQIVEIAGIGVAVLHGHGSLKTYLGQKILNLMNGYHIEQYLPVLLESSTNLRAAVFGHTHTPEIIHLGGKLLFNPGSASVLSHYKPYENPTVGLMHFRRGGQIEAEIVELKGKQLKNRQWVDK
jgi:putative phosphoesterase